MPHVIYVYNHTMGGVDLFDNAINNYRIRVRGKKWYWALLTHALDTGMVNAWKLHRLCCKVNQQPPMGQLEFFKTISEITMSCYRASDSKSSHGNGYLPTHSMKQRQCDRKQQL